MVRIKKMRENEKNFQLSTFNNKLFITFAPQSTHVGLESPWKDGRVVDYTGLENRRTARCRGFESLSFRFVTQAKSPADWRDFCFGVCL